MSIRRGLARGERPRPVVTLWHVLLTSRLEGSFAQDIETLELGLLTPEDAVAYLLKATEDGAGRSRTPPLRRRVGRGIDHLTLALVHAGAYIANGGSPSLVICRWHGNRARVLDWAAPDVTVTLVAGADVDHVDGPVDAGRTRAAGAAVVLRQRSGSGISAGRAAARRRNGRGLEPLLNLQRFSLITRIPEFDRFVVHRIVRDVTSRRLATDPGGPKARLVEAWLDRRGPRAGKDRLETIFQSDPLLPHAEAVAWAADRAGILNPTHK